MRTLVWFRGKDLRMHDHAPLHHAMRVGEVIPLFVLDPYFFAPERARNLPHRMQFLLDSLRALESNLAARGSRLIVVAGKSVDVVPRLARAWKVDRVVAQRWSEPFARERDARIAKALEGKLELFEGELLLPPDFLRTGSGTPFRVFTHFARAFHKDAVLSKPLAAPKSLPPVPKDVNAPTVEIPSLQSLGVTANPNLIRGGEEAARARLRAFLKIAASYPTLRDRMDLSGTSRLSADLKFGTLSVREVWTALDEKIGGTEGARVFQNELLWREFAHSTLWHHPNLLTEPFRVSFAQFPWENGESHWQAWVTGHTGYPVVDAAARQLLQEGFVHNRARMIAASFLTKHLLVDFRRGEAHYLKFLVDGDWANNDMGWQWSAGCGCDAQPYFRVFNPMTQGERFDPNGDYVRRWVPELGRLPTDVIHQPWEAQESVLAAAGVRLGQQYPRPIVEHRSARARFLLLAKGR